MCRLFGFRSVIRSQVHSSLLSAENALGIQSEYNPDGWGVAYYLGGAPHLIKSANSALSDRLFHHVSGVVASETVVAHVRLATHGVLEPTNSHPFQHGKWIFAHNGNLSNFEEHRDELMLRIDPDLRRYILGNTDSEVIFFLLLTHMRRRGHLHSVDFPVQAVAEAARAALDEIEAIVGCWNADPSAPNTETFITFIITNGEAMLAHQGGKRLYYSTWKNRCPDRDSCPSFSPCCEAKSTNGFINHLLFSSEPLQGENVWVEMAPGQMLGVDGRMRLQDIEMPNMAATWI